MSMTEVEDARQLLRQMFIRKTNSETGAIVWTVEGEPVMTLDGDQLVIEFFQLRASFPAPILGDVWCRRVIDGVIHYGSPAVARLLGVNRLAGVRRLIKIVESSMLLPGALGMEQVGSPRQGNGAGGWLVTAEETGGHLLVGRVNPVPLMGDSGVMVTERAVEDLGLLTSGAWRRGSPRWRSLDGAWHWGSALANGIAGGDSWSLIESEITDVRAGSSPMVARVLAQLRQVPEPAAEPAPSAAVEPQGLGVLLDQPPGALDQVLQSSDGDACAPAPDHRARMLDTWTKMRATAVTLCDLRHRQNDIGGPGIVAFLGRRLGDAMIMMPTEANASTAHRLQSADRISVQVRAAADALLALSVRGAGDRDE